MIEREFRWTGFAWKCWETNWLRVQAIATPICSLLVTLWLSQSKGVGRWWNTQADFEAAAIFASAGILFYTASFAALELGVMILVLAWKVKEYFDKKLRDEGIKLALEANRQKRDDESLEQAIERLKADKWKPTKS